jgi:hypothetical protein
MIAFTGLKLLFMSLLNRKFHNRLFNQEVHIYIYIYITKWKSATGCYNTILYGLNVIHMDKWWCEPLSRIFLEEVYERPFKNIILGLY